MFKISNEGIGNLTVEVYDGNSVVKVHNAIVKITGHYKPTGHFQRPVSFSDSTRLHGFVKFTDIPVDIYKVEVSKKGYKPAIIENASAKIPGKDPVGHFAKPNNLARVKMKKWSFNFVKPSRAVDTVFLHCSASDSPEHDSVDVMTQWHKKRGFSEIGYHYFIKKNGVIQIGRSLEKDPAAQKGYNKGSIAICLHGLDVNKFTALQFNSLIDLCHAIKDSYCIPIRFRGHKEVAAKSCPVFNYKKVLQLNKNGYMS